MGFKISQDSLFSIMGFQNPFKLYHLIHVPPPQISFKKSHLKKNNQNLQTLVANISYNLSSTSLPNRT